MACDWNWATKKKIVLPSNDARCMQKVHTSILYFQCSFPFILYSVVFADASVDEHKNTSNTWNMWCSHRRSWICILTNNPIEIAVVLFKIGIKNNSTNLKWIRKSKFAYDFFFFFAAKPHRGGCIGGRKEFGVREFFFRFSWFIIFGLVHGISFCDIFFVLQLLLLVLAGFPLILFLHYFCHNIHIRDKRMKRRKK